MPKGVYIRTAKTRRRLVESHKGKYPSEETKRKMKENNAKYWLGKTRDKETIEKIIKSQKGKHHSPRTEFKKGNKTGLGKHWKIGDTNNMGKSDKTRKLMSALKQGVDLNEWKGFISFKPYNEKFTQRFKNQIRKRDNYICMLCGKHQEKEKKSLDVHHITYDKLLSILENCVSLCHSCHIKTNMNRKHWIKFFQSLLSEKYGYQYENNLPVINIEIIK